MSEPSRVRASGDTHERLETPPADATPVIRRAFAGTSPVDRFAGLSREKLRSNGWIGAAAGLVLFLAL